MINIKDQIPSIYYDASRDFQILGHLYEVVLNYSKTNADMLYLLPDGIKTDTRATELLAMTLGFKLKRNYDKEQLAALVSILPQLLKIKGTIRAVELAGNALIKAAGIDGSFDSTLNNHILTIKIPQELSDITLFMDLLPYILPFGIRVSVIRTTVIPQAVSMDFGATSVVRLAIPGIGQTDEGAYIQHPLGLAKVSEDATKIIYSDVGFIDSSNNVVATRLLGATPVITFSTSNSNNNNSGGTKPEEDEEIN